MLPPGNYSCSPPGDGSVCVPSVLLLFLCELFLLEGLSVVSAEDSVPLDFSALEDFFEPLEPFVPELEEELVASEEDVSPFPCVVSSPW